MGVGVRGRWWWWGRGRVGGRCWRCVCRWQKGLGIWGWGEAGRGGGGGGQKCGKLDHVCTHGVRVICSRALPLQARGGGSGGQALGGLCGCGNGNGTLSDRVCIACSLELWPRPCAWRFCPLPLARPPPLPHAHLVSNGGRAVPTDNFDNGPGANTMDQVRTRGTTPPPPPDRLASWLAGWPPPCALRPCGPCLHRPHGMAMHA